MSTACSSLTRYKREKKAGLLLAGPAFVLLSAARFAYRCIFCGLAECRPDVCAGILHRHSYLLSRHRHRAVSAGAALILYNLQFVSVRCGDVLCHFHSLLFSTGSIFNPDFPGGHFVYSASRVAGAAGSCCAAVKQAFLTAVISFSLCKRDSQ